MTSDWCGNNFQRAIFKLIMQNGSFGIRCEIVPRWMSHRLCCNIQLHINIWIWLMLKKSNVLMGICLVIGIIRKFSEIIIEVYTLQMDGLNWDDSILLCQLLNCAIEIDICSYYRILTHCRWRFYKVTLGKMRIHSLNAVMYRPTCPSCNTVISWRSQLEQCSQKISLHVDCHSICRTKYHQNCDSSMYIAQD